MLSSEAKSLNFYQFEMILYVYLASAFAIQMGYCKYLEGKLKTSDVSETN